MSDNLIKTIFKGYLGTVRDLGLILIFVIIAGLVSAGLIYPMWLFATKQPALFTALAVVLIAAAILGWVGYRIYRRSREKASGMDSLRKTTGSLGRKILKGAAIILMIYAVILLFGSKLYLAAGAALLLFFFITGWLVYGGAAGQRKG